MTDQRREPAAMGPGGLSPAEAAQKSLSYSSYLRVDELLGLQRLRSDPPEHDETLFIIIHQVYELWFKQLLHEFDRIRAEFGRNELYDAMAGLKRCRMIMKTLVQQLDVLETMTPMSFRSFRSRLESASGFQSAQFRELEFLLGYKRRDMLAMFGEDMPARERLERRLREPSVVDAFYAFLRLNGFAIDAPAPGHDLTTPTQPNEAVQDVLVVIYKTRPDLANLLELMTDFDEGLQEWRYRHVKMVERTIGLQPGTGGSSGAEFLRRTLFRPVFPDLWAIRHRL